MIRLTIYRVGETIELTSKTWLGKDFTSNVIREIIIPANPPRRKHPKSIKIRPYYRKKIAGVLNIFCEEEL